MNILSILREKSRVFGVIVVTLFLAGFIYSSGTSLSFLFSKIYGHPLAYVYGERIELEEFIRFNSLLEKRGLSNLNEKDKNEIIWNLMVQNIISETQIKRLNIKISDTESIDIVQGNNISPILINLDIFKDAQTKTFSKKNLRQYLASLGSQSVDEQTAWNNFEANLIKYRKNEKVENILKGLWYFNKAEIAVYNNLLTKKINFNCLFIPISEIERMTGLEQVNKDVYKNNEAFQKKISEFYNNHKDNFKVHRAMKFNYIVVPHTLNVSHYNSFRDSLLELAESFYKAQDDIAFSKENSDLSLTNYYVYFDENEIIKLTHLIGKTSSIQIRDILSLEINESNLQYNVPFNLYKVNDISKKNGKTTYKMVVLQKFLAPSDEVQSESYNLASKIAADTKTSTEFNSKCENLGMQSCSFTSIDSKINRHSFTNYVSTSDIDLIIKDFNVKGNRIVESSNGYIVYSLELLVENENLPLDFVYEDIFDKLFKEELCSIAKHRLESASAHLTKNQLDDLNLLNVKIFENQCASFDECKPAAELCKSSLLGSLFITDSNNQKIIFDVDGIYMIDFISVSQLTTEERSRALADKISKERFNDYNSLKSGFTEAANVKDMRYKFGL